MTSCPAAWQASPQLAPRGILRNGVRRGGCVRVVTHVQAGGSQDNQRVSSPQKSPPASHINLRRKTGGVDSTSGMNTNATTTTTTGGSSGSGSGSGSGNGGSSSAHHAFTTSATFQRTSWYGAVSSSSPPPAGRISVQTQAAAGGVGDAGGGGACRGDGAAGGPPHIVKKATGGAAPGASDKPFVEPTSKTAELKLPRESESQSDDGKRSNDKNKGKKPILTRLLRTPLSGGVLNSMKDADLPSVAVAARNLMELADYADLSTIMSKMNHRRTGYPFASTVDFATDADGHPIFCLTPLAMHTRNLAYNARASLTVKMNGWGGLANARVTIFGDVHRLPAEYQNAANEIFKAKYEARKEEVDLDDRWGDYTFYRMNNVIDVYFVGGFGTLNWVDLKEYREAAPDKIVTPSDDGSVLFVLAELNTKYGARLAASGAVRGNAGANETHASDSKVDDLWIISIDKRGIDVRVRVDGVSHVRRLNFHGGVETYSDACSAVEAIIEGRAWRGPGSRAQG